VNLFADPLEALIVLGAGVLAGAGNVVAGGGTTLSFPILVWIGLPAKLANITNALGLLAASVGGSWSYRDRIRSQSGWALLWIPALLGSAVGAALLLALPSGWFGVVAPWLVIGSAVLVAADPLIRRHLPDPAAGGRRLRTSMAALFAVAIYAGYFGAGIGILVLATLRLVGVADMHDANGLKNVLVGGMRTIAAIGFVISGLVVWPVALVMMVGSLVGGWSAGRLVQRLKPGTLRWIVVAIGLAMGASMLLT
jgi:uncharacterized membrane protein YfcA